MWGDIFRIKSLVGRKLHCPPSIILYAEKNAQKTLAECPEIKCLNSGSHHESLHSIINVVKIILGII